MGGYDWDFYIYGHKVGMLYTRYNVYMLSRPHVSALTFQQNVGKHLNLNGNSSAPSTLNTTY